MDHHEQTGVELDNDPLPNPVQIAHRRSCGCVVGRVVGSQDGRGGHPNRLDLSTKNSFFERLDIHDDVREFRHRLLIGRLETTAKQHGGAQYQTTCDEAVGSEMSSVAYATIDSQPEQRDDPRKCQEGRSSRPTEGQSHHIGDRHHQ
jgi:hypothetical protein